MKCNINNKYKKNSSDNQIKRNIEKVIISNGYGDIIYNTIINMYEYMIQNRLEGACHAISSVLYVALNELGLNPKLCIGECAQKANRPFDHSWIMVDNKIIDLAIFMPLEESKGSVSGPIIFDKDIVKMADYGTNYGISSSVPFDSITKSVLETPFLDYMANFPNERNGLWTVLEKIMPEDFDITVSELIKKYSNTTRCLIR